MNDIRIMAANERATMDNGSRCFDYVVTPLVRPGVQAIPLELRQAWWDGFLAAAVGAMVATIGEKGALESCADLFTRARDFAADLRQQKGS